MTGCLNSRAMFFMCSCIFTANQITVFLLLVVVKCILVLALNRDKDIAYFLEPREWYKLQSQTLHKHTPTPKTDFLLISFHIRRTQGGIKKYKGIQWQMCAAIKEKVNCVIIPNYFTQPMKTKFPVLLDWNNSHQRCSTQKNGYTLQSIKELKWKKR